MRLVTRADWDGLVCATLLSLVEQIDFIQFTYPKDVQDSKTSIPNDSIIANLPYHPDCAMWFDHHISEEERGVYKHGRFKGKFAQAPSSARLVYEYYGADKLRPLAGLVEATDRIDTAQLTMEDVVNPTGYVSLAYTIDPRTGLKDLDRQAYFLMLIDLLKTRSVEEILSLPEVRRLTERLRDEDAAFREALRDHSRLEGNVVITDFRRLEPPSGNRFIIYTLFPAANVSARLFDSPDEAVSIISVGHSIFNRTCQTNVGSLLGEYGGGGHRGVGTAQFPQAEAEEKFKEIIERLKKAG
jgi:hypothetical protein